LDTAGRRPSVHPRPIPTLTIVPFDVSRTGPGDPVKRFAAAAERYVVLIDDVVRSKSIGGRLEDIADAIASLYALALHLPLVDRSTDEPIADASLTNEQWQRLFEQLRDVFGDSDEYRTLPLDPSADDEVHQRSIAEDLADTYRDVKEGLDLLLEHAPEADVVWHWRFSFRSHWGKHAVEVLRAIHALLRRW